MIWTDGEEIVIMEVNQVNIRLLKTEDCPIWKKIRLEAVKAHPEAFGSSYEEESLFTDDQFNIGLTDSDIFGAFINDELAGTAGFFIFKYLKMKHRGNLFGMYVKPEYRNRGVASQLIEMVISHAQTKVLQLHCSVVSENQVATQFYEKYGFQIYGTEPKSLKVGEKFYDEHLMALQFK